MWPFKKKSIEVETLYGTIVINGLYTIEGDPFQLNKVRVTDIKNDSTGTTWIKYKVPFSTVYMTRKAESFMRIYKRIKD